MSTICNDIESLFSQEEIESFFQTKNFSLFTTVVFSEAVTYGSQDKEKRHKIRQAAFGSFPEEIPDCCIWAFGIVVTKSGNRKFDVDNVPKLIIDAFDQEMIEKDHADDLGLQEQYLERLGLYRVDQIDNVPIVLAGGKRNPGKNDRTEIYIFNKDR